MNNTPIIRDIRLLLEQLLNLIYEEILKNLPNLIDKENLNSLLSDYYKYRTINKDNCINNIHFKLNNICADTNLKLKSLYYDLMSIKFLLKKCESYDLASLYNIFKEIKDFSENQSSIFSYQDSTTENLIFDLCNIFKNNLYAIKYNENRIITEEESIILDEFFELYIFINMEPEIKSELRKILENNIIELKCENNFFKINYFKYIQLINIIESKLIANNYKKNINNNIDLEADLDDNKTEENIKKEEVLIITDNECIIDNFKSIFNIYGFNKKLSNDINFFNNAEYLNNNENIYKEFFEYNFRKFLISKREFLNRYKILSSIKSGNNLSNYCKENLLLHYMCYQLTRSFDIKHEGLFDRIYDTYQKNNNEIDLLPSEFAEEITEDIFNEYIQQNFNEEEIFPLLKIDYISLNYREYYKKEISLIEKLRNKNYTKIILFDYNTNILRNIECFICNYNQSINCIVFFIDYNSYSFKIDFNNTKIESLYFKNIISTIKKGKNKNINMNLNNKDNSTLNKSNEIINIDEQNNNQISQNFENNNKNNNFTINKEKDEEKFNIIIDYREMGTKTPYYLYKNNFNIINGSLQVGDYILTNNYCIERKSISTKDLYQSLNSKHLLEQTIKMGKYYKNIIILLEFEEHIDILNTFEKGICYKPIILRKLLDLTNITELEKNNCLFMWSLNCSMTSRMLKSIRYKLKDEILDIDYCLHINKTNKTSKNKKKNGKSNNSNNNSLNINDNCSNSQKIKTIDSFFNLNNNIKHDINTIINNDADKNKEEENIKKYETQNNYENYAIEIKNKKLDISIEKFVRNVPGINSTNYNFVNNNFNNLYEFITCEKEKKFELFGRINGTKILSLFNYEYQ
jgi:ERCC4-type nuclease